MDYITLTELTDYIGRDAIPAADAMRYIHSASRHIYALTFGRISKIGFDNLSDFQKDVIKESTALLAKFEYENEDLLNSALTSYSINGVSMSFGEGLNVQVHNGVVVNADIFNLLSQTGLTTLNLYI